MIDQEETNIGAHALLITKNGRICLQQRDTNPKIVNPGLISIFGGTLKRTDSIEVGLIRELREELELQVDETEIEKLDVFYKTKAVDGVDWEVHVFIVRNVDLDALKLHEGRGIICETLEKLLENGKLTRITRLALEKYQNTL